MTTAQELQEHFRSCMPIFIALGDEVRLSIIEALTENALSQEHSSGPVDFGYNINSSIRKPSFISCLVGTRRVR